MATSTQPRPPAADPEEPGLQLTFLEHLEELRKRIIHAVIAFGIAVVLGWFVAEPIFHFLMEPVLHALPKGHQSLVYTSAMETFFVYLKVALYTGVFIGSPVFLYELWKFVAPGLYARERRMVLPFVLSGTGMFIAGGVFAYYVILPNAFKFLLDFSGAADWTRAMLTLKEQLSLVLFLELAFGAVFEIPLLIAFLAFIGLIDAKMLSKYRRHAIVGAAIFAAVLTPTTDPFNMTLMFVPTYLFYEVGILLARIIGSRRAERAAAIAAEEAGGSGHDGAGG